jgi:hypothetical protein
MTWMVYSGVSSNLVIEWFQLSLTIIHYLQHNYGPEGRYPCQSFTGALRSLLAVGFELA